MSKMYKTQINQSLNQIRVSIQPQKYSPPLFNPLHKKYTKNQFINIDKQLKSYKNITKLNLSHSNIPVFTKLPSQIHPQFPIYKSTHKSYSKYIYTNPIQNSINIHHPKSSYHQYQYPKIKKNHNKSTTIRNIYESKMMPIYEQKRNIQFLKRQRNRQSLMINNLKLSGTKQ